MMLLSVEPLHPALGEQHKRGGERHPGGGGMEGPESAALARAGRLTLFREGRRAGAVPEQLHGRLPISQQFD